MCRTLQFISPVSLLQPPFSNFVRNALLLCYFGFYISLLLLCYLYFFLYLFLFIYFFYFSSPCSFLLFLFFFTFLSPSLFLYSFSLSISSLSQLFSPFLSLPLFPSFTLSPFFFFFPLRRFGSGSWKSNKTLCRW